MRIFATKFHPWESAIFLSGGWDDIVKVKLGIKGHESYHWPLAKSIVYILGKKLGFFCQTYTPLYYI